MSSKSIPPFRLHHLVPVRRLATYRLAVLSRVLAAGAGGYGLAYAVAVASARWLPLPPPDAVVASTMLGFLALAIAAIVVFACASAWRAWAWVGGAAILFTILAQCPPGAAA
jgi:hypothetical protein